MVYTRIRLLSTLLMDLSGGAIITDGIADVILTDSIAGTLLKDLSGGTILKDLTVGTITGVHWSCCGECCHERCLMYLLYLQLSPLDSFKIVLNL